MKQPLFAALACIMLAAPVYAEETRPEGQPSVGEHKGPHGDGHRGGRDFMKEVDTNGDEKISREEFHAKGEKMFKEADSNGDGFITKEEGKAAHEARRAKWEAKRAEFMKNKAATAKEE